MVKLNRLGLPNTKYSAWTAMKHALKNTQQRKGRSIITGIGVILGISFIVTLITYSTIIDFFDPTSNIAREQSYLFFVGLLLCVVGVMNSMFMEVGQRNREIGTYMTLGTMPVHVVKLFMFESLFIGIISGFIGSILGVLLGMGLSGIEFPLKEILQLIEHNFEFYLIIIILGTILSTFLTLIASIIPVIGASRMNPADALRKT